MGFHMIMAVVNLICGAIDVYMYSMSDDKDPMFIFLGALCFLAAGLCFSRKNDRV